MRKLLLITLDELGGTIRGLIAFFARFIGMILPEVSFKANLLVLGLFLAGVGFWLYSDSRAIDPAVRAAALAVSIVVGAGMLGTMGYYVATHRPRNLALIRVAISLGILLAIGFVVGHPVLPGPGKLGGAAYLLVGAIVIARRYVRNASTATVDEKPMIRGAVLALLPFYLVAVTNLFWGLNQTLPRLDDSAWFVEIWRGSPDREGPPAEAGDMTGLLQDPKKTYEIDGWTFWGYSLQKTTGIAMAPAFEKAYWYIIHPIGSAFGANWGPPGNFNVGRMDSWHVSMEILQNLVGAITTAFFLGVIFELGASVQRKLQTGQADLDLSRDYGVALLSAVHGLNSVSDIESVKGSWEMMRRIRHRAVDELVQRLTDPNPRIRAASALTLGNLNARRAALALDRQYDAETAIRPKSAILVALSTIAPLNTLPRLKAALRGDEPVISHTALTLIADMVATMETAHLLGMAQTLPPRPPASTPPIANSTTDDPTSTPPNGDGEQSPADHGPTMMADEAVYRERLETTELAVRSGLAEVLIEALDAEAVDLRRAVAELLARLARMMGEVSGIGKKLVVRLTAPEVSNTWRQGALTALGALHWPGGESALVRFASHADVAVRRAAIRALGGHTGAEGLHLIRRAVDDADAGVRLAAFDAVAVRGLAPELSVLLPALRDVDEACKIAAARALGKIAWRLRQRGEAIPGEVFDALAIIARDRQDSLLRDEACFALAHIGDSRAVDILVGILPDPEAAKALGMLGDSAAVVPLARAARETAGDHRDSFKRLAPIHALGQLGAAAVPSLIDIYVTRPEDRKPSAEALGTIGGDSATEFLLAQFNPRDLITAEFLAPALADTQDLRARDALIAALDTASAPLAAKALGDMRDDNALRALIAHHDSTRADVRDAVWGALRKFFADPTQSQAVVREVQRQARVRGMRALSLVRAMYRFAGVFFASTGRDTTYSPPSSPRPRPEDILAEFG